MLLAIFTVILDILMVWYNTWLMENEKSKGWKRLWTFFVIFWLVNVPFDVFHLLKVIGG